MKQLKLDQAVRNLTFCDLEIPLVVIVLELTGLKRQESCISRVFWGKGGEVVVCVERLGLIIGLMLVLLISFPRVVFTH